MTYEIFLILLGIYIEQTYNLPSFNKLFNKLKKQDTDIDKDTYFIGKNFLRNFYNNMYTEKK